MAVNICAYVGRTSFPDIDVEDRVEMYMAEKPNFRTLLEHNEMIWLQSDVDKSEAIMFYRSVLQRSTIPFRDFECPLKIMTCCGMCIRRCYSRCTQDILHRVWMYINSPTIGDYAASVLKDVCYDNPNYRHVTQLVYEYFNTQHKYNLGEILKEYPKWIIWKEHSHKFNYAPRVVGDNDVQHWPATGLCPFCIPPTKQKRGRKKNAKHSHELRQAENRTNYQD